MESVLLNCSVPVQENRVLVLRETLIDRDLACVKGHWNIAVLPTVPVVLRRGGAWCRGLIIGRHEWIWEYHAASFPSNRQIDLSILTSKDS